MRVEIPTWCIREVTSDVAYTGGELALADAPPKE
jgi:hypothetical protein